MTGTRTAKGGVRILCVCGYRLCGRRQCRMPIVRGIKTDHLRRLRARVSAGIYKREGGDWPINAGVSDSQEEHSRLRTRDMATSDIRLSSR